MEWLQITLWWSVILFLIGSVTFPLTVKVLNIFAVDLGYPFAKTISIIIISYIIFVASTLHLLPFSQLSIIIVMISMAVMGLICFKGFPKITRKQLFFILLEETIFIASLIFWTVIRGQEASIRSLEKFMDFGFINSILKSEYFPPKDIWYSGFPINYYYFGHLTGAVLIKLTRTIPAIGYNLILSTIFALGITQTFSLVANIISSHFEKITKKIINPFKLIFFGILGAFIVNLSGNLHTIYLFTTGYPNEEPVPFWKILSWFNPSKYWYPNATRFIPLTIHEFPSYSYVVADLHGHVFDIPFVLLTIAILFIMFIQNHKDKPVIKQITNYQLPITKKISKFKFSNLKKLISALRFRLSQANFNKSQLFLTIFLGFLTAIHYMTNAFDGPVYILLSIILFFFIYKLSFKFFSSCFLLIMAFFAFSFPFSHFFTPFINGIGVNCSPQFLVDIGRIGPFLFEKNNCQVSPLWMLFILWGFFWINFILFFLIQAFFKKNYDKEKQYIAFFSILFLFGTFLIIIPEFFYIKDIYPAHFRANTMFKLGYQAFIIMGIASAFVFYEICKVKGIPSFIMRCIFISFFAFVIIYPFFSVPSYYGTINKPVELDGSKWLIDSYPEDKEIIDFLNENEKKQPAILEAQGDSYSDYERISAFTGLPTIAGWWVHEWLWRGSPTVISDRIPDVTNIYESSDEQQTRKILQKYKIKYIVVSRMERQKYPNLNEEKIEKIGELIFRSNNGFGALYQVN